MIISGDPPIPLLAVCEIPGNWPSDPEFWNTLVRLNIYTAFLIERAEQSLEEVADLESQINSYFEEQAISERVRSDARSLVDTIGQL